MDYIDSNFKIVWINFMLFLITCPVIGQVKKTKQLLPEEYKLWSTLSAKSISDHGKWVSYSLSYESRLDTLFVKNTTTKKIFAYAKGFDGQFIGETWFGYMLPENKFQLQNLLTGKIQDVDNVKHFKLVNEGQYIILFCSASNGKMKLIIRNVHGVILETIANVTSYSLSPKKDQLVYCASDPISSNVGLLQFGEKIVRTSFINSNVKLFENVVWHREEKSIVFIGRSIDAQAFTASTVLFYRIDSQQLYQYDTLTEKSWPKEMVLDANFVTSLGISDDEQRVFFKMKKVIKTRSIKNNSEVQVWNAADKELYPLRKAYGNVDSYSRLAIWYPKNGKFMAVGDKMHPSAILNGNQKYAVVYNDNTNKPSFKHEADRNYYLMDLKTGVKSLFLKQQSGAVDGLIMSPNGKYILYFKNANWWVYSFSTLTHTNITKCTGISFYDDFSYSYEPIPYGIMGWTANDKSLLLYDQFDVWEFSLDEKVTAKKLTNGRKSKQIFRLHNPKYRGSNTLTSKNQEINFKNGLILKVKTINHSNSGFVKIYKDRKVEPIVIKPKWISSIGEATKKNVFMYLQEDYNEPPSLFIKKNNAQPQSIFKSNPQHSKYRWGFSKLIDFKNSKGISLKGALYYPFNYNPQKKYPMIVNIYEKKSKDFHIYTNPSLLNGAKFNVTYFTSQGYFVLMPDIDYEIGNPGFSAADCVISATNTVLNFAPINKNRLGLIGHSFGGYETDFIITQTNLFKAAVAGAGVSDLTSCYFSIGKGGKKMEAWRFEHYQMRMGKPWFEDKEGYRSNSPLDAVSNVKTPLLSYTGENDPTVNPYQTLEFYLALRRLKKNHIMLIYPKDSHVIENPENQIDLTSRISDWFGYYLKGEKKPEWFNPR